MFFVRIPQLVDEVVISLKPHLISRSVCDVTPPGWVGSTLSGRRHSEQAAASVRTGTEVGAEVAEAGAEMMDATETAAEAALEAATEAAAAMEAAAVAAAAKSAGKRQAGSSAVVAGKKRRTWTQRCSACGVLGHRIPCPLSRRGARGGSSCQPPVRPQGRRVVRFSQPGRGGGVAQPGGGCGVSGGGGRGAQ